MKNYHYGSEEWFENKFSNLEHKGDGWGHNLYSSQKYRMGSCLEILAEFISEDNLNILDVGCAACDFTNLVYSLNKNNNIFASDISKNAVTHNSSKYKEFEHSVQRLPKLDFKDSNFDTIIALEVINYLNLKEREEAMQSVKSKLKSGGHFLFSTVISNNSRYFTEDEAVQLLKNHFQIRKIKYNYSKLWEYLEYIPTGVLMLNTIYTDGKIKEILYLTSNTFLRSLLTNKIFIRFIFPLIKILSKPSFSFLTSDFLVSFVNNISKIFLPKSGKSHVIILAQK